MNEADWLHGTDPQGMLEFLRSSGRASDRKLRLFAVACSRRVWDLLDPPGQEVVTIAELFADGLATPGELRTARLACRFTGSRSGWYAAATHPAIAARNAALSAQQGAQAQDERLAQAHLLRDIFANPLRPLPSIDLHWITDTIKSLAEAEYKERSLLGGTLDNARLAILAGALEQAGCTDAVFLDHLRNPAYHVRGCHALDAILGRA
jgi:hypothetical protein